MQVKLKRDGVVRKCPLGTSWTVLLLGWLVPFFRLDFKWGLVMLIGNLVLSGIWPGYAYEIGGFVLRFHLGVILNMVMSLFYNAISVSELLEAGFLPVDDDDVEALFEYNLYVEDEDDEQTA